MPDNRVKPDDVHHVIETNCPTSVIEGYIDDANLEVTERVNAAEVGYTSERMTKLEKYLSAHFVRFLWDRQETETSVTNVSAAYSGAFGEGLTATSAGQTFLDTDTADVFEPTVTGDDDSGEPARFVTRDKYVREVSPTGKDRAEGTERHL